MPSISTSGAKSAMKNGLAPQQGIRGIDDVDRCREEETSSLAKYLLLGLKGVRVGGVGQKGLVG